MNIHTIYKLNSIIIMKKADDQIQATSHEYEYEAQCTHCCDMSQLVFRPDAIMKPLYGKGGYKGGSCYSSMVLHFQVYNFRCSYFFGIPF